jgi:hypothetical protein
MYHANVIVVTQDARTREPQPPPTISRLQTW